MPATAAEKAVFHIVRRVQEDASFAWLMIGTESFALCCKAVAKSQGKTVKEVRKQLEDHAASTRETPEIVILRKEVERLEASNVAGNHYHADPSDAIASRKLSLIEELVWQAECGRPLQLDELKAALAGKKLAHI